MTISFSDVNWIESMDNLYLDISCVILRISLNLVLSLIGNFSCSSMLSKCIPVIQGVSSILVGEISNTYPSWSKYTYSFIYSTQPAKAFSYTVTVILCAFTYSISIFATNGTSSIGRTLFFNINNTVLLMYPSDNTYFLICSFE